MNAKQLQLAAYETKRTIDDMEECRQRLQNAEDTDEIITILQAAFGGAVAKLLQLSEMLAIAYQYPEAERKLKKALDHLHDVYTKVHTDVVIRNVQNN